MGITRRKLFDAVGAIIKAERFEDVEKNILILTEQLGIEVNLNASEKKAIPSASQAQIANAAEFKQLKELLESNQKIIALMEEYCRNKDKQSLARLRGHLINYQLLISYSTYYKEIFCDDDDEDKDKLGQAGDAFYVAGAATGEGPAVPMKIIERLSLIPSKFLGGLHSLQNVLGPISYFLYGIGALLSVPLKLGKALKQFVIHDPSIPLPHQFSLSHFLSALLNIAVSGLYISAALIFAGYNLAFLGPVGIFLHSWGGLSLGAAGTFLGWLGNNVIDRWRVQYEYNELQSIQQSFPGCKFLADKKKRAFYKKDHHAYLGVFMVLGMALFSLASFLPADAYVVPLLPVTVSWPTLIGSGCFVYYAKDWILENIFCLPKKEVHVSETPASTVPSTPLQGQSAERALADIALHQAAVAPAQHGQPSTVVPFAGNGNHTPGFGYATVPAGSGLSLPHQPTQAPAPQRMD